MPIPCWGSTQTLLSPGCERSCTQRASTLKGNGFSSQELSKAGQGWRKSTAGVPQKKKSCWVGKGLTWSLGSQKEGEDTKSSLSCVYKVFPVFLCSDCCRQWVFSGLCVGQKAAQLGLGLRSLWVVPYNILYASGIWVQVPHFPYNWETCLPCIPNTDHFFSLKKALFFS